MASTPSPPTPVLPNDPRFRAGRQLVGEAEGIEIFATLLAQARSTYSATHVETIPGYYEYGNALLRYVQRQSSNNSEEAKPPEVRRDAAAVAAERRASQTKQGEKTGDDSKPAATLDKKTSIPSSTEQNDSKASEGNDPSKVSPDTTTTVDTNTDDDDDLTLALEMMETAWSILDEHLNKATTPNIYATWMKEQRPRILIGLGDALTELQRPADATDAYLQALAFRQEELEKATSDNANAENSIVLLELRLRVVEANILVTEALLSCKPYSQAVVTSETKAVLVPAGGQVVSYAQGYYDKAVDELQEAVVLFGQLAESKVEGVAQVKEYMCHLATIVMGAGEALAQIDQDSTEGDKKNEMDEKEPAKKKARS